jgi:site-specific recombinase XerD
MFEELFDGPIALARHRKKPLPEERRRFLSHLQTLGYTANSLKTIACELIVIATRLNLAGSGPLDAAIVEVAAQRWARRQRRRHRSRDAALSARNFRYWAEQWLRYLGRWQAAPPAAPPPNRALLDGFMVWMADEQGLAPASIRSHGWKTSTFLAWYGQLARPFADVAIQDVDDFLAAKGKATWSRRSVAIAAQALRAFFRYAECQQHCRPGIAALIAGPRLFDQETLPAGPPWADVQIIVTRHDTDHPADIRRRAALLLFATYGFRVGEVARLTLDDLDWEQEILRVRRSKRFDVQRYPLTKEVGGALLRYITRVRPRGGWREIFLTLLAPYRPLSCAGLWSLASPALLATGLQTRHHGPHALRHACATRLLSEGWSLKDIGDHLGHRSADATAIYAKVDLPGLREVARFDLGGLL